MKRTTVQRSILTLGMALAAGTPLEHTWAAPPAHNVDAAQVLSRAAKTSAAKTFKGTTEQMQQWGPIQVSITVKGKKITAVKVAAEYHTSRSQQIQSNAIPLLKEETLKAQSARINTISGATDTSGAYITSLQAAVRAARHAKALK